MTRRAFLAGEVHQFLAASVLFKIAPAGLPGEPGVHRALHALDAAEAAGRLLGFRLRGFCLLRVRLAVRSRRRFRFCLGLRIFVAEESHDVAEHLVRGIDALEILLKRDALDPGRLQFLFEFRCKILGNFLFQRDIHPLRVDARNDILPLQPERCCEDVGDLFGSLRVLGAGEQETVEDDIFQRFVPREGIAVHILNLAAPRREHDLRDVALVRDGRVLVVLIDREEDQPRRECGEDGAHAVAGEAGAGLEGHLNAPPPR